jgi:hypothetical protein
MELKLISSSESLEKIQQVISAYFEEPIKLIQMKASIFEQYHIRPIAVKHIPNIWRYRVVVQNGLYNFGEVK